MLWNKGLPIDGVIWRPKPVHVETLIFGWIMQLAMGCGVLDRTAFPEAPKYGRVWLAMCAYALLNAGVLLSSIGMFFIVPPLALIGRVLLLIGVLCFVAHILPRVRPYLIPSS
ncbi:MAG: hypothetical protein U0670_22345 [Anaerolineae bacterium]